MNRPSRRSSDPTAAKMNTTGDVTAGANVSMVVIMAEMSGGFLRQITGTGSVSTCKSITPLREETFLIAPLAGPHDPGEDK